jgi:glutamate synthase domain-containing protein 2/glutamate synthase domain-containing protein 1/glutamate synthase domain-containing protein 3
MRTEHSACGVGFIASLTGACTHQNLELALGALVAMEHRGACAADGRSGDGSGVMTDIPFDLLGHARGSIAVATLFLTPIEERRRVALHAFESAFDFLGLRVASYRDVPTNLDVLGPVARACVPHIVHAFIHRPPHCGSDHAFNSLLYQAKALARTRLRQAGAWLDLFFTSLSTTTIVYKAMVRAADLEQFYPDLANPRFKTRFALFHRRFSTNTRSTWDKTQPFRLLAHNGEINTIAGNRSWSYSRERALGLAPDELLTHEKDSTADREGGPSTQSQISDSGSVNEMVEALKYRSSIPHLDDILAIMIPPAGRTDPYYRFWGRAMEPWDGPALIAYGNGETVGARLDRNGFRPARWCMTDGLFCLASEAGVFAIPAAQIRSKGTLQAGTGATVQLGTGKVHFRDPSQSRENNGAVFEPRLVPLREVPDHLDQQVLDASPTELRPVVLSRMAVHGLDEEEVERILVPMILSGKEPIGSMGDTARLAIFSDERRSLYDFLVQQFAQVTNPPLDYLREAMVTDLVTHLGPRPNIFAPKELIPPAPALELSRPVLSLQQMQILRLLRRRLPTPLRTLVAEIDCTFDVSRPDGLAHALERIGREATRAVDEGHAIVLLSDRHALLEAPAVPSVLALRAAVTALDVGGQRLCASIVLEAGDIRTTHQLACAIGFGATAVCPHLALEYARFSDHPDLVDLYGDSKEERLVSALCQGLLKVMSKMGISVVRSYCSSKLFSALGLGPQLVARYLEGIESPLGGLEVPQVGERIAAAMEEARRHPLDKPLPGTFQLKEKNKGGAGERHAMTAARARIVHDLVRGNLRGRSEADVRASYDRLGAEAEPVSPRHLLDLRLPDAPCPLHEVEPAADILRRFGSGAMSFGAISAEAQRDLFIAMRRVGGRCNSGEGGENPYYFVDGTTAVTKQVASARFGVDAEYLASATEIEIKIAQGAKPGEGGQLMGVKVDEHIARARHASVGVDLISPAPLHDIYSIEDLKQLIYELQQVCPGAPVCVKLVAGPSIGTIAVGVVKAGAAIVQISGADGGTGAAAVSSMKHAGWPWELGLDDAHKALTEHGLRGDVRLRVDGGLSSARDVVLAAALGADEFGFGKLLLVAQGCIMARICENNRCPTGIATHDPKFKAKYKGTPDAIESLVRGLADGVREELAALGLRRLDEIIGQRRFLRAKPRFRELVERRGIDLARLLEPARDGSPPGAPPVGESSPLNRRIIDDVVPALDRNERVRLAYAVTSRDRAVGAGLAGELGRRAHRARMNDLDGKTPNWRRYDPPPGSIALRFDGSAGQGFAAFTCGGVDIELRGEANDAVAKSMSSGRVVVRPPDDAGFVAEESAIVGNCCLYGATGGTLFVHGMAGDRFAVRNSGAIAVVEGVGLHACEYMTGGTVVILGRVSANAGAGMTGGQLWMPARERGSLNLALVQGSDASDEQLAELEAILRAYVEATGSATARALVEDPRRLRGALVRVAPREG